MSHASYIRGSGEKVGAYRWGDEIDCEVFAHSGRLYYLDGDHEIGETHDSPANRAVLKPLPDFELVRLFTTQDWAAEFLAEHHIARAWDVYVYDKNLYTNLCEFTPSYELNYVDSSYELEEGVEVSDEEHDRCDDEYLDACSENDIVKYVHCADIDKLPDEQRHWYGGLEADDEDEAIQTLVEYYIGNPVW